MSEFWWVLTDILVLLSAALLLGVVCEQFRQSPILGYLAAGTLLGPNALGWVSTSEGVEHLAELGVAMLLFTIGLEFSWPRLRRLGMAALGGGACQVLLTMGIAAGITKLLGMSTALSLTVGAIVSLSSTACVLRLLAARAELESSHGRYALGILLMQDIAVVPLVLMVTVLGGEGSVGAVAVEVLRSLLWAGLLVAVLYVLLNYIVPRLLDMHLLQRNRDLPVLLALTVGLGSALGSHELGLSPALGAFVAGMILAESPFAMQIRADVGPVKTLLVTLFFGSIGMLGDPQWFMGHLGSVLGLVAAIVLGKAIVVWGALRLFGVGSRVALATGICLGQVGEFSFVLAAAARGGVIGEELFTLLISVTIVTLFLTPYLVKVAPAVSGWIASLLVRLGLARGGDDGAQKVAQGGAGHVVIIGLGPAGQAVSDSLQGRGVRVVVLDMNSAIVREARRLGIEAHIGDATHADVLGHLGVERARAVVVSVPDPGAAARIVQLIKTLAPRAIVIVRGRYHMHLEDLEMAGADEVLDEERLVGLRLAASLRKTLRRTEPGVSPPRSD